MKRLLSLFIFCIAFATMISAQTTHLYNTSSDDYVNIRSAPGTSSKVVRRWYVNDESSDNTAVFISASGNWYKVRYKGTVGYVHFSQVQATSQGYSGDCVTSMSEVGYANIRKSPSKSASVVGKLPNYGVAKYLGRSGSWYKIRYNGVVGYVSDAVTTTQW